MRLNAFSTPDLVHDRDHERDAHLVRLRFGRSDHAMRQFCGDARFRERVGHAASLSGR
jgi:hypothetical protein